TWPGSPPGSAGAICRAPRFQSILPNRAAALRPGFPAWYAGSSRVPWPAPGFLLDEASKEWISPTGHGPVPASRPGKSAGLSRHPATAGRAPAPQAPVPGCRTGPRHNRLGPGYVVSDMYKLLRADPRIRWASGKTALPGNRAAIPAPWAG